jgi:DNA protecting protein DprA
MLSRELAQRGVTIISGLARGIDAAAHRGALEAGGRTVGVMGTGLDQIYPRDHKKLADEILEKSGALVTQFPLGTPPVSENFPYRNRVISGLSLGVVVVEAAENSGSLITARLAMEQNREVFAVPGNITSRNSFGTSYLIKGGGAKLVQQWQDIARVAAGDCRAAPAAAEQEIKKEGRADRSTPTHPVGFVSRRARDLQTSFNRHTSADRCARGKHEAFDHSIDECAPHFGNARADSRAPGKVLRAKDVMPKGSNRN